MSILSKIFHGLELGKDSFAVWVEATDGDGIAPDLTEVAQDILVVLKDFEIEPPEWVTVEMIRDALATALKYLASNKP